MFDIAKVWKVTVCFVDAAILPLRLFSQIDIGSHWGICEEGLALLRKYQHQSTLVQPSEGASQAIYHPKTSQYLLWALRGRLLLGEAFLSL